MSNAWLDGDDFTIIKVKIYLTTANCAICTFTRVVIPSLSGNTVPAQLSKLSLPSVRAQEEDESDGSLSKDEGKRFL